VSTALAVLALIHGDGKSQGPAITVSPCLVAVSKRHDPSSFDLNTSRLGALYTPPECVLEQIYFTRPAFGPTKRASSMPCLFLKICNPDKRKPCWSKKA